jgi:PAS domain S-box-containing protein
MTSIDDEDKLLRSVVLQNAESIHIARQLAERRTEIYLNEGQRLAHMGSWALNRSGGFDYWSPELFRIHGLDSLKGSPTLEEYLCVVHKDDRAFVTGTMETLLRERSGCDIKKRIVLPDGEVRHVRWVGAPVFGRGGAFNGSLGIAMDVTDQEELTEELRRREGYLNEAQRLSRTGSFGWNVASGEIYWSDETFRIFEYDRAVKPTIDLVLKRIHPGDRTLVQQTLDRASGEKTDFDFERRLLMPFGGVKYVHIVAHAVKAGLGDLEYIGAVTDVSDRKHAEDELQNAFDEIRKLKDRLYEENIALREEIDQVSMFEEIIGSSNALRAVLVQVEKVAPTDSTVLITGETGTGKELIARAIHNRSGRSSGAFVRVNCAAIPQSLIASELFGHERGAFTGATQRRIGRFELAHRGTILLDEVGELPAETQVALLRVLQEREFERVGGNRSIVVDVRVLAATNRDLNALVEAGTFRRDLFYRLNVFPVHVPSLRDRIADIPLLVEYLIERYAKKAGKKIKAISRNNMQLLQSYNWPGNVRELQNVIERAIVLSNDDILFVDETWLRGQSRRRPEEPAGRKITLSRLDAGQEREIIEAALAESRGQIAGPNGAAVKLGVARQTLDSKIRSLGINKYRFKFS